MGHQGVVRGCWEKDNKDAGKCTPVSETVGDLKYTRHCCKSNKCNDDSAGKFYSTGKSIFVCIIFRVWV